MPICSLPAPDLLRPLLPGLWTAVLAAGLVYLLGRWFDRLRRRDLLVYAAVLTALFGRVLFAGDSLLPLDNLRGEVPFERLAPTEPHGNPVQSDLLLLVAPAQAEVRRALADGRWPSRSGRMGAGMPLLADPQAQAAQPLTLAAQLFEPVVAAGVTAALKVWLALLFTGLWLRRQGLAASVALVGSLAWGLGGFLLLWLGWPLSSSAAWLPVVLYGISLCQDRGGARDVVLLAASLSGLLLAGHPETAAYACALAALVAWSRWRARPSLEEPGAADPVPLRRRYRALWTAAVVAVLIAAPVWLPAALYAPQSVRAERMSEPAPALPPAGERAVQRLLPVVAPSAFGNDRFVHYWGFSNVNEDAAGFVGTVCLLLVLIGGMRHLGRAVARKGPRPGDAGHAWRAQERLMMTVVLAVAAVLALPPGLAALLRSLPGGALSSYHHRLLLPLGFGLVYLAACELDRWRTVGRERSRIAPVLLAVGVGTVVLVWGYLAHPNPTDPALLEVFRFGWLRWQLRFLGAGAALLVVAAWTAGGKRWLPYGVAALLAAELLLLHRPANPPMPPRLAFPVPPPLALLQAERAAAAPGAPQRLVALDRALPAHLASVYGLSDLRTAGPMAPAALYATTAPLIERWQGEAPIYSRLADPLYDRLGVRWVLAPPDAELAPPLRAVMRDGSGSVWERPGALPIVRLAESPAAAWEGTAASLQVLAAGDAHWSARLRAQAPRRLATALYQDGGWRLLLDGVRRPVDPRTSGADQPFVSAPLPAGEHRIDLVYRPPGLLFGALLAALGWAALLAGWLRPRDATGQGDAPGGLTPIPARRRCPGAL
jgi:hypothetical protein